MSELDVVVMMNGVPVKCKARSVIVGGTVVNSTINTGDNNTKEMSLKELAQRLSRLNEMDKKGDRGLYEEARLLDDELEIGGSGLRISYWDTDQAYCVYVKEGV